MTRQHTARQRSRHGKVSVSVALAVTLVAAALIVVIGTQQGRSPNLPSPAEPAPPQTLAPQTLALTLTPQILTLIPPALPVLSAPASLPLVAPPSPLQGVSSAWGSSLDEGAAHAAQSAWTHAEARAQALRLTPSRLDPRRRAQPAPPQEPAMTPRALMDRS